MNLIIQVNVACMGVAIVLHTRPLFAKGVIGFNNRDYKRPHRTGACNVLIHNSLHEKRFGSRD